MSEWSTWRPEDFLLFSPRVYWRLFELHNAAWWPLPLLLPIAGLAMLALVMSRPAAGRWLAALLAAAWAFVSWSFVWSRYATINWAAAYLAPLFAGQALLLALAALRPGTLAFDRSGPARWAGALLAAFALVGQPLLAPLLGRSLASAEIAGLAPDPTAIATLGFILLGRGALVPWLLPVPLLWCLLGSATLWTMGATGAWIPAAAALATIAAMATGRHARLGQTAP